MTHAPSPTKVSYAPSRFASEIEGFTQQAKLSRREVDIVVALIRNITNSEDIAQALRISTHTVNNHLKSIFEKTNTKSKTEILSNFLRFAAENSQKAGLMTRKPRVLVIDDEPMISDHIDRGLTERGARVYTLNSPELALDMISKYSIDVVVCDVRMPTVNGKDVLREVRSRYPGWPLFIFVTGFPDYSLEECHHLGAAAMLEKPLNLDTLFATISSLTKDLEYFTPTDEAINLITEAYNLKPEDIGFGGVFVDCDSSVSPRKFPIGSLVEVPLTLPNYDSPIKVKGRVVWKREKKVENLRTGVGLQILSTDETGAKIFDHARRGLLKPSYIPLGSHSL